QLKFFSAKGSGNNHDCLHACGIKEISGQKPTNALHFSYAPPYDTILDDDRTEYILRGSDSRIFIPGESKKWNRREAGPPQADEQKEKSQTNRRIGNTKPCWLQNKNQANHLQGYTANVPISKALCTHFILFIDGSDLG